MQLCDEGLFIVKSGKEKAKKEVWHFQHWVMIQFPFQWETVLSVAPWVETVEDRNECSWFQKDC